MKLYGKYVVVIVTIVCIWGIAGADSSFRCGNKLVSLKDSRDEVIKLCGEPTSVDSWVEERIKRDRRSYQNDDPRTGNDGYYREPLIVKIRVNVELWTYNLGSTRLIHNLRFENGIVQEITTGGKGY
jgi:hypothetical protein